MPQPLYRVLLFAAYISITKTHGQETSATYSVYFKTGNAGLDATSRKTLDSLLYHNLINRSQSLTITGYADEPGTATLNDSLSRRRAQAVADYLQEGQFLSSRNIARITGDGARHATRQGDNPMARRVDITTGKAAPTPAKISTASIDSLKPNATFELDNLLFEGGSDVMLPASLPQLQQLLQVMKDRPTLRIRLEGHICCGALFMKPGHNSRETEANERQMEYGRQLSERRAQAVYRYLNEAGISRERMSWRGFGYDRPKISPEKTPEDAVANRRVEVRILSR